MARRIRQVITYNTLDLQPNIAIGIKLPYSNGNGGLFQLSYSTHDQAISNLKNLILTRKGERYMQPTFGTDLYDILFENNVEDLPNIVRDMLTTDIAFWLPYIIINDIVIKQKTEFDTESIGHNLQISLIVQVGPNGANVPIIITVTPSSITVQ